jgi:hypothetical protein
VVVVLFGGARLTDTAVLGFESFFFAFCSGAFHAAGFGVGGLRALLAVTPELGSYRAISLRLDGPEYLELSLGGETVGCGPDPPCPVSVAILGMLFFVSVARRRAIKWSI